MGFVARLCNHFNSSQTQDRELAVLLAADPTWNTFTQTTLAEINRRDTPIQSTKAAFDSDEESSAEGDYRPHFPDPRAAFDEEGDSDDDDGEIPLGLMANLTLPSDIHPEDAAPDS